MQKIKILFWKILGLIPFLGIISKTKRTQTPVRLHHLFWQKIIGYNSKAYWPVHFTSIVSQPQNVYCGIETCPGYSPGCYIQAIGKIYIGDYTQIAANVGIISANHDLYDNSVHIIEDVKIGAYCWIGMGALIMPGVVLGDFTIVAAGSVVTKSFPEGHCVIGGNVAKVLKTLDRDKCIRKRSVNEYNGYIKSELFEQFREKHLTL